MGIAAVRAVKTSMACAYDNGIERTDADQQGINQAGYSIDLMCQLYRLRAKRGLTIYGLAARSGVHPRTIEQLENNPAYVVGIQAIHAIAAALGAIVDTVIVPNESLGDYEVRRYLPLLTTDAVDSPSSSSYGLRESMDWFKWYVAPTRTDDSVNTLLKSSWDGVSTIGDLLLFLATAYREFSEYPFDRELSVLVLEKLMTTALRHDSFGDIEARVTRLLREYASLIREIVANYSDDSLRNLIVFQPECLLVWALWQYDGRWEIECLWEDAGLPADLLEHILIVRNGYGLESNRR